MLFSDVARRSVSMPAFASSSTAVLAHLRQQTFPKLIDPPRFLPRSRAVPVQPDVLTRSIRLVGKKALLAMLVVASAVLVATSLPAWGDLASGNAATRPAAMVRSSAGETGEAATRVESLGAHSFLSRNPFVSRMRLLNGADGDGSPFLFVAGARQASIAAYVTGLGFHAALPYQNAALKAQKAVDSWNAAVIDEVLEQQGTGAAPVPVSVGSPPLDAIWSSNLAGGTVISNVTVTFYACVGNGFCGNMATGHQVYPGAAACSYDMAFGTKFVVVNDPSQQVFTCMDRGALASPWVDIWFYSVAEGQAWAASVGGISDIRIVN